MKSQIVNLLNIKFFATLALLFADEKRVGSSATVSLVLENLQEVNAITSMLEKHYSLLPSSEDFARTNSSAQVTANQNTNTLDNWHWDQAKANELLYKANHASNRQEAIDAAMSYASMDYEARVHGMPSPPSEFPLPNPPGDQPIPDYQNFYSINDHFPKYLLCEYDVDIENYKQADEPEWFKAALKQIRQSGPTKFPSLEWVAVIIINRSEWNGADTFEQAHKVGAIFKASDVFNSSCDLSQLIAHADTSRHPFEYDTLQPTPGDQQRWLIVEQHAATNSLAISQKQ